MMKRTKRFLQLLLAVAMLPTLSSVAQSESVVALSGNAYVTALAIYRTITAGKFIRFPTKMPIAGIRCPVGSVVEKYEYII